jgi:hypothetical protein
MKNIENELENSEKRLEKLNLDIKEQEKYFKSQEDLSIVLKYFQKRNKACWLMKNRYEKLLNKSYEKLNFEKQMKFNQYIFDFNNRYLVSEIVNTNKTLDEIERNISKDLNKMMNYIIRKPRKN